ncbi:MAG: hypothetical protein ACRBN8_16185 [Nannocystales bacterium]
MMRETTKMCAAVALALGLACGGSSGSDAFANDSASGGQANSTGAASTGEDTAPTSASTGAISTSSSSSAADDSSGGDIKLDVGAPEGGLGPCGCELAYIWIANADQGTVSKINVRTLEEEGRYITRPDGNGNPSRTSVNLAGDVAVANRHGGLTKIFAEEGDCLDTNGTPGIQTSSGPGDVLPWGVEECVAWHTEFATTNQRPVAWIGGAVTPGTCDSVEQKVWTVSSENPGLAPGIGGAGGVRVSLLDGDSGLVEDEIIVPQEDFGGGQLGAYGGAVDAAGNLFFVHMGTVTLGPKLGRVAIDTLEYTTWDLPAGVASYGITLDHFGNVWISSTLGSGVARFDPETETWDTVGGFISLGGLAEGPNNFMWIATSMGAVSVNIETLERGPTFIAQGGGEAKGVSADVDGYIWVVNEWAWKVDPATGLDVGSYTGLNSPYTYSDMTGYALGNVICPPEG